MALQHPGALLVRFGLTESIRSRLQFTAEFEGSVFVVTTPYAGKIQALEPTHAIAPGATDPDQRHEADCDNNQ